jgi:hypothetical protein
MAGFKRFKQVGFLHGILQVRMLDENEYIIDLTAKNE